MKTKNFKDLPKVQVGKNEAIYIPSEMISIINEVTREVSSAEKKHPNFVHNLADGLLVVGEELGEAQQAYLQHAYEGGDKALIRKELVHTAATVMRLLLNLDGYLEPEKRTYTDDEFMQSVKTYMSEKRPAFMIIFDELEAYLTPSETETIAQRYERLKKAVEVLPVVKTTAQMIAEINKRYPGVMFTSGDSPKKDSIGYFTPVAIKDIYNYMFHGTHGKFMNYITIYTKIGQRPTGSGSKWKDMFDIDVKFTNPLNRPITQKEQDGIDRLLADLFKTEPVKFGTCTNEARKENAPKAPAPTPPIHQQQAGRALRDTEEASVNAILTSSRVGKTWAQLCEMYNNKGIYTVFTKYKPDITVKVQKNRIVFKRCYKTPGERVNDMTVFVDMITKLRPTGFYHSHTGLQNLPGICNDSIFNVMVFKRKVRV